MNRRDFMKVASGVAGGSAVAGAATSATVGAQETTTESSSNNTTTSSGEGTSTSGSGGGGGTATVEVGPGGNPVFTPGTEKPLYISPGTTVTFKWKSSNHNINVDSQPDGSNWQGVSETQNKGYTHEHTFDTLGEYHYWCDPHKQMGMVADITVNESGQAPGGGSGGGHAEADPEHMGVPFQAHYVGIATIVMMIVSLIYTFFFLKYGESPNTSSPNR